MTVNPKDIAIETLQNQSSLGAGTSKKMAFVPINTAGVATERDPVNASNAAVKITLTVGMRTLEIQNTSSTLTLYYGGLTVTSARGIKLFPNQTKIFANVQDDFAFYVVADGAETPEYRIVEWT